MKLCKHNHVNMLVTFEALHGIKDNKTPELIVNLREKPCTNSLLRECWLWKEPVCSRRFEQYTLLVFGRKTNSDFIYWTTVGQQEWIRREVEKLHSTHNCLFDGTGHYWWSLNIRVIIRTYGNEVWRAVCSITHCEKRFPPE